jgi:hypothetical protein
MDINKHYNFSTLAPTVLGGDYENMKAVIPEMPVGQAIKFDPNIYTQHETLRAVITNLPISPNDCTFILMENSDGVEKVFAKEYIDLDTVLEASNTFDIDIKISNGSMSDISVLQNLLKSHGYVDIVIKTS